MYKLLLFSFILITEISSQTIINKNWLLFNTQNSVISSDHVTSILPDNSGGYWIVTSRKSVPSNQSGLLHYLYNNQFTIYDSINSPLTKNTIEDVALTKDNKLLVATDNGLLLKQEMNGIA